MRKLVSGLRRLRAGRLLLKLIPPGRKHPEAACDMAVLDRFSPSPGTSAVLPRERPPRTGDGKIHLAVIVPVFRVERYIRQCLESLLRQETVYRYQVILVNDGTPDRSMERISDLLTDPRVLVVEQENQGFSQARNAGLDRVCTEYVAFVDSDDYVLPDMVQRLLETAYRTGADLVAGGYLREKNGRVRAVKGPEGAVEDCYALEGLAWGKVFRAELFRQIRFPPGYWFEDTVLKHLVYPRAKKIYGIPAPVYVYRLHPDSISATFYGKPKSLDSTWITAQMLSDRKKLGLPNDERYLNCFLRQLALNFRRENGADREVKRQVFYWMAELTRSAFAGCGGTGLPGDIKKLYEALLRWDYRTYRRLCLWL